MYEIIKPKRFSIYVNPTSQKRLANEVRKETGADIVINGTLYDVNRWVPVCDVKKDGKILSNDKYSYWGYGWNKDDSRMQMCNDINKYSNYISAVALLRDGENESIIANPDVARLAGRTAIGFTSDGRMVVWCTKEGENNMRLETLRDKMKGLGCVDALALDGGGSSQLSQEGNKYVYSTRRVQNYICIWKESNVSTNTPIDERPHGVFNIGSQDEGSIKWIQSRLNEKFGIPQNGVYDTKLKYAVQAFQAYNGLVPDGIVGENTLKKLEG